VHQAVLDAVVHHLGVVPGADRPGVHETVLALRLERVEDRHEAVDVCLVAADHQAVAVLPAPHPAGDPGVDVPDAVLVELLRPRQVVAEPRVPAVDDDVAGGEDLDEPVDSGLGVLGRHHHPDGPGSGQLLRQLRQTGDVADPGVPVEADHLMPGGAQPLAHVAAHPAEAYQAELH
jgi:hypothetical protein